MENTEYTIFITCNGGKTYNIHVYKDIYEAKNDLYNMIELEKRRNRPYYVYNDFYDNEYPASLNCKIFCLKERIVTDWKRYYESFNAMNNMYKFPTSIN